MRRRFSRRKKGSASGDGRSAAIDAERVLARIVEEGVVSVPSLEVLVDDEVPASFAAVGTGEREDGKRLIVAYAPANAGDAVLAGLATGARLASEADGFDGEVVAVAPRWSSIARRRLGLVGELSFGLSGAEAPALGDGAAGVEPETAAAPLVLPVASVGAQLADARDRELFARASAALEGLASKHGGAVRGCGNSVELVILSRRVAELRAADGQLELLTILPQRSSTTLGADDLAEAFDRLEGHLRKRLNDRRTRDGEDGLRTRVVPLLAGAQSLRAVAAWPLGGSDEDAIDLVGVAPSGDVVVAVVREEIGLGQLSACLDAYLALQPMLPTILMGADAPVRMSSPRLALAAQSFAPGVTRALGALGLSYDLFEVRAPRGRGFEVAAIDSADAPQRRVARAAPPSESESEASGEGEARGRRRRPRRGRGEASERPERPESSESSEGEAEIEAVSGERDTDAGPSRARRGRSRGGRGRGARGREGRPRSEESSGNGNGNGNGNGEGGAREAAPTRTAPRFDEFSSFDLEEEGGGGDGEGRPRRRGRSRRRGRRGSGGSDTTESEPEPAEAKADVASEDPELAVDDDQLSGLADLPDEVDLVPAEPTYDDEEDVGDEADAAAHAAAVERERRRLARQAKVEPEPPRPPRRRAVILAHADRDSLVAAIVLARDVRLLEGMWVYPQADLMTFFRSVATDLREDTPIYVVGFTPSPSRDVLQAASLYGERLVWFDHHEWPPEDVSVLKQSIGEDQLHLSPGAGSALPQVMATCTRRSRFSDKLVDLATGRFTLHDYERWGRLWWSRLGDIAQKSGEVRSDVDPLLVGRPSDLAREAARSPVPDLPIELDYVSRRDFRLVHFGGYSLVVADLEPDIDLHLAARIARERHGATLSLSYRRGEDLMILAGDELAGSRSLDFGAVVEHLCSKLEWVEPQADADHVARFRIRDLAAHPERLEEVLGTIAMGRSILER